MTHTTPSIYSIPESDLDLFARLPDRARALVRRRMRAMRAIHSAAPGRRYAVSQTLAAACHG